MSHENTLEQFESFIAVHAPDIFHGLVEIDHPDFASPFRLTDNTEDVVHDGDTYTAHPLRITLPRDKSDRPPEMTIEIGIVDFAAMRAAVRSVDTKPTVTVRIVSTADTDVLLIPAINMTVARRNMSTSSLTLTLNKEDWLEVRYPSKTMNPYYFPGLFR